MKRRKAFIVEVLIVGFLAWCLFLSFAEPKSITAKIFRPVFSLADLGRIHGITSRINSFFDSTLGLLKGAGDEDAETFLLPECRIDIIKKPESIEIGKEYEIIFEMTNAGADSTTFEKAFSGIHIEAANASLRFVSSKRSVNQYNTYKWGEVKMGHMAAGEKKRLVAAITPRRKPVTIYYRGWIPGKFSKKMAEEIKKELSTAYKESGVWRNERTISRFPANDDADFGRCRVRVKAARGEYQKFRCAKLVLN